MHRLFVSGSTFVVLTLLALALGGTASAGPPLPFDIKQKLAATPNAKVEIIEFSDFQCPFCSKVEPTLRQLEQQYGDALRIVFMNQPLSFHPNARSAAIAVEAARNQGRFREMHEKLFANQRALEESDLEAYAVALGLDLERWRKDVADPATAARVDAHSDIAHAVGANGTPAFFINGRSLRGAQPLLKFQAIIDEEIAAADHVGRNGDAWIRQRLAEQHAELYGYLYGGKVADSVVRGAPRPDKMVYKVTVDPKVDAWKGEADAPVTVVVFADFQCPFCQRLQATLTQLSARYPGQLRFVFKHNPLPGHKSAVPAAYAALCAQEQGRFWEMHDALFEHQATLDDGRFSRYANDIGLDVERFEACHASAPKKLAARIAGDQDLAVAATARGTPNVFVNGRKIIGAKPLADFEALVTEELTKATKLGTETGLTGQRLYVELVRDGKVFRPLEPEVHTFVTSAETPIDGKPDAKVVLTIFSDFQCPFCSRLPVPLKALKAKYGKDLAIVFKHFPLSFHKEARPAAQAAVCAGEQGKFWPFHDLTFVRQTELSADMHRATARTLKLDMARFESCLTGAEPAIIERDAVEAREAGVRGTPTIYINGRKFNSSTDYGVEAFTTVIDRDILGKKAK